MAPQEAGRSPLGAQPRGGAVRPSRYSGLGARGVQAAGLEGAPPDASGGTVIARPPRKPVLNVYLKLDGTTSIVAHIDINWTHFPLAPTLNRYFSRCPYQSSTFDEHHSHIQGYISEVQHWHDFELVDHLRSCAFTGLLRMGDGIVLAPVRASLGALKLPLKEVGPIVMQGSALHRFDGSSWPTHFWDLPPGFRLQLGDDIRHNPYLGNVP